MFCKCGIRQFRNLSQVLETLGDASTCISGRTKQKWSQGKLLNAISLCITKQHLSTVPSTTQTQGQEEQDHHSEKDIDLITTHVINSPESIQDFCHKYLIDTTIDSEPGKISADNESPEVKSDSETHYNAPEINVKSDKRVKSSPHYPLMNLGDERETFTPKFDQAEKILQSLNVPTNELPFYPDVQEMSYEEMFSCVERLKEIGIHKVFSLFLIQRIFGELKLEETSKRAPLPNTKNWFKLRNGKYKLTSLQAVSLYLELCRLLEDPHLDLYGFVDSLASVHVYEHLNTVLTKIKQLKSLGATPKDILSNLTLLKGSNLFKAKVRVYKTLFRHTKPVFPVNLFLSTTMTEFREKLQVGRDVSFIANLLDVTPVDFLMCWGFKPISTSSLEYKIHMCLKAGISKQDIFNNISMVNRLSLRKSQVIMESLLKSGYSASLYELKAMEEGLDLKNMGCVDCPKDWTSEDESELHGTIARIDVPLKTSKSKKKSATKAKKKRYKPVESSKIWRMEVFRLITHLLELSPKARQSMYKANISVDSTLIQDITKNLEHLSFNLKFTKEQISSCPLILAHPHQKLCFVTQEVETMLDQHFAWAETTPYQPPQTLSSSASSLSLPTSQSLPSLPLSLVPENDAHLSRRRRSVYKKVSVTDSRVYRYSAYSYLLTDPITHLNLLQYFLEKDTGFSLTALDTLDIGN